jgi:hypothetical protein
MDTLAKIFFENVAELKYGAINVTRQKCFGGKLNSRIILANVWFLSGLSLVQYISISHIEV